jgi:hypothetical protein
MKVRLWVFSAPAGLVVVVALGSFVYLNRQTYICQDCGSQMDLKQWRVGSWPGGYASLGPAWEIHRASRVYADFLGDGHAHRWRYRQGSPYYWFGTLHGGCALGAAGMSSLAWYYEGDPRFRQFLARKIDGGGCTREEVRELVCDSDKSEARVMELIEEFWDSLSTR